MELELLVLVSIRFTLLISPFVVVYFVVCPRSNPQAHEFRRIEALLEPELNLLRGGIPPEIIHCVGYSVMPEGHAIHTAIFMII